MKNAFKYLTLLLFLFTAFVHADERKPSSSSDKFTTCEKIYLQPEQISITDQGIFLLLNNEWVTTSAIHYDAAGLFINSMSNEWSLKWTCPRCGYGNSAWRNVCYNCGYRPAR